jgi:putative hydrolase of the HAD superfamily
MTLIEAANPVRNVIFDFGGVLITWRPNEIIDQFYRDEALRERVKHAVFQHPDWIDIDRGMLDEEEASRRFAARMERPLEEMTALMQHVRKSLLPIPESFAIVRELESRGIPLYGLSNISVENFSHLEQNYDLWRSFRGIVISAKVRMVKPEARIFEHICAQYGLAPRETVFIDDHSPNIETARRLGFQTILFSSSKQCEQALGSLLGL